MSHAELAMKVLVVGSGGAEHVLARALRASPGVRDVFVAPGNVGMTDMAATINLEVGEAEVIAEWATEAKIDLVVLGGEAAGLAGVADACLAADLKTVGPSTAAAALLADPAWVEAQAAQRGITLVSGTEVEGADQVLVIVALADGATVRGLGTAIVFRRLEEQGRGPLTDGMGACSPAAGLPDTVTAWLEAALLGPLVSALSAQGLAYRGFLCAEVVVDQDGGAPRLIRVTPGLHAMGSCVVLPRLKTDVLLTLLDAAEGQVGKGDLGWSADAACAVTLVSDGYPNPLAYETGYGVQGVESAARATFVAHEATRNPYAPRDVLITPRHRSKAEQPKSGGLGSLLSFGRGRKTSVDAQAARAAGDPYSRLVTGGGRVVTVVALGSSPEEARQRAYGVAEGITYTGRVYRQDIGAPTGG